MSAGANPDAAGRRETILVVDGDALSRNVVEQVLRHHGYRALLAANLSEAMLVCGMADGRIDLLIVDTVNTGMPGPRVVSRLRVRYPGLRCLYLTKRSVREDPLRDLPLAPLVTKPFGVRTLLRTIRATLEGD